MTINSNHGVVNGSGLYIMAERHGLIIFGWYMSTFDIGKLIWMAINGNYGVDNGPGLYVMEGRWGLITNQADDRQGDIFLGFQRNRGRGCLHLCVNKIDREEDLHENYWCAGCRIRKHNISVWRFI